MTSSPREDLQKIHTELLKEHQRLSRRLERTQKPEEVDVLMNTLWDLWKRINEAQGVLLRKTLSDISPVLKSLRSAQQRLDKSMKNKETVGSVIRSVSKLLSVVDKALKLAKKAG